MRKSVIVTILIIVVVVSLASYRVQKGTIIDLKQENTRLNDEVKNLEKLNYEQLKTIKELNMEIEDLYRKIYQSKE